MKPRKRRNVNPRRIKVHRIYTIYEAALRLGVTRRTVRRWIKAGLPLCDHDRPPLIRGQDLRDFLLARQAVRRHPCQPGQIYCVACRAPVFPMGNMADYVPRTNTSGDLMGLCPHCERAIYRHVNVARLAEVRADLDVAIPKAHPRLTETLPLSVDVHLQHTRDTPARTRPDGSD